MKIISCFVICCLFSAFGHDGVNANCHDVTTKLVAFETAVMGQHAPMVSGVVQSAIGIQLLNATYIEQYTCPFLASRSIADVGNSLRSSGLLRLLSDTACALDGAIYSKMKAELLTPEMLQQASKYLPPEVREFMETGFATMQHLEDMGFFNLNPAGFQRLQAPLAMLGNMGHHSEAAAQLQPYPGNPGAYSQAQREAILIADIHLVITKARAVLQGSSMWPMIVSEVNMYSGGLVDLNNTESIDNITRALAATVTMDATYEFLSNTVMMPLLNFYYPKLGPVLTQAKAGFQRNEEAYAEYVELGYISQQVLDQIRLMRSTFETFLTALRATGVLDVQW